MLKGGFADQLDVGEMVCFGSVVAVRNRDPGVLLVGVRKKTKIIGSLVDVINYEQRAIVCHVVRIEDVVLDLHIRVQRLFLLRRKEGSMAIVWAPGKKRVLWGRIW